MIDRFLDLRNRNHWEEFRFDLTPQLWKRHYLFGAELDEATNVLKLFEKEALVGYAVFSVDAAKEAKACRILDICTERSDIFAQLIEQLVERCVAENVDFIYFKQGETRFNDVLSRKGFLSFLESVIMVVLLDPGELFSSISEKVDKGKVVRLNLVGLKPVQLRIGKDKIQVVEGTEPDYVLSTNSETFLKLLFGRTSFIKEFVRQRIRASSVLGLLTIRHFLKLVKQKGWFIPSGDWL